MRGGNGYDGARNVEDAYGTEYHNGYGRDEKGEDASYGATEGKSGSGKTFKSRIERGDSYIPARDGNHDNFDNGYRRSRDRSRSPSRGRDYNNPRFRSRSPARGNAYRPSHLNARSQSRGRDYDSPHFRARSPSHGRDYDNQPRLQARSPSAERGYRRERSPSRSPRRERPHYESPNRAPGRFDGPNKTLPKGRGSYKDTPRKPLSGHKNTKDFETPISNQHRRYGPFPIPALPKEPIRCPPSPDPTSPSRTAIRFELPKKVTGANAVPQSDLSARLKRKESEQAVMEPAKLTSVVIVDSEVGTDNAGTGTEEASGPVIQTRKQLYKTNNKLRTENHELMMKMTDKEVQLLMLMKENENLKSEVLNLRMMVRKLTRAEEVDTEMKDVRKEVTEAMNG